MSLPQEDSSGVNTAYPHREQKLLEQKAFLGWLWGDAGTISPCYISATLIPGNVREASLNTTYADRRRDEKPDTDIARSGSCYYFIISLKPSHFSQPMLIQGTAFDQNTFFRGERANLEMSNSHHIEIRSVARYLNYVRGNSKTSY